MEKGFNKEEKEEIQKFLVGKPPLDRILEDKEYPKEDEQKYVYKEEKEDEKEKKNNSKKDK